ncbi:MAG TPA: porin family protein [Chitinophagaceae bacterium]|nr:porin family protein [Chitinophagaceae bacterium]
MKKIIAALLIGIPAFSFSQIGIKAGINFSNVTKASDISNSNTAGFHAGLFLSPATKGVMGYRTELLFSQQGYNYKTGTNTGNVNLNYLILPQYMTINITKYFQLQLGGQIAFLLNAKADSSNTSNANNPYGEMMDYYNKFDYGYGGGIEVHPIKGLLLGARVNISLSSLYKDMGSSTPGTPPSFIPEVDVKNNLFQIFAGWQFGK